MIWSDLSLETSLWCWVEDGVVVGLAGGSEGMRHESGDEQRRYENCFPKKKLRMWWLIDCAAGDRERR